MDDSKTKKEFKVPHTYVIIFTIIIIAAIATYLVPAGTFERIEDPETGRDLVDPDSFHYVEQSPVSFLDVFRAIPQGMTEAGWIIFLVFIIGGSFGIINSTGAIEAGIGSVVGSLEGKEKIIIPGTVAIFALGGATFGLAESTLIFIPMGVTLARALGFDAVVGMAMVNLGACAGFAGGALNIFTTGVAQGIAGLPLFSGLGLRIALTIILVIINSIYILRYAMKIKKNPEMSVIYDIEKQEKLISNDTGVSQLTNKQKIVLIVILIGFIFIVYGVTHNWSTGTDLSAIFLVMGIVSGLVYGHSPSKIAEAFVEGAKGITFGALVVGVSRGIVVILESGQIIDTIINSAAGVVGIFPPVVAAGIMLIVQVFINFFINSGSGQAATTMPIMAPLADMVGVPRQTAVLAYNMGDGLSNSIFPTSGVLMAGLSIAKIPYEKWLKFVTPLMIILHLAALVIIMFSVVISYGPF